MKFKLLLGLLCFSTAQAQSTLTQALEVSIDPRFGLFLHENQFNVDLTSGSSFPNPSVSPGQATCYRAGFHNKTTGYDEVFNILPDQTDGIEGLYEQARFSGDGVTNLSKPFLTAGSGPLWPTPTNNDPSTSGMLPVTRYPGLETPVNSSSAVWKGPITCANRFVLEVFSNNRGGFRTTATLNFNQTTFPKTLLAMRLQDGGTGASAPPPATPSAPTSGFIVPAGNYFDNDLNGQVTLQGASMTVISRNDASSAGWRTVDLLQGILLDGTEAAGTYTATIVYRIVDF